MSSGSPVSPSPNSAGSEASPIDRLCHESFERALAQGLPTFPSGVDRSTPLNSSPYLVNLNELSAAFSFSSAREQQLACLSSLIVRLREQRLVPRFVILGGSFVDRSSASPRDVDGALFYSVPLEEAGRTIRLRDLQAVAAAPPLDIRLLPFDSEPALVAKFIGFFCTLYGQRRVGNNTNPSLIVRL